MPSNQKMRRIFATTVAIGLCIGAVTLPARGQPAQSPSSNARFVPSLASLMGALQLKHAKLWFAGRLQNWPLADYELDQIRLDIQDAAALYTGIPDTDVTTMAGPLRVLGEAIEAKEDARFAEGFRQLTAACNSCHESIGRGFIVIQVPTSAPVSNQAFSPRGKQ